MSDISSPSCERPSPNTYWVGKNLLAGEYPGSTDDQAAQAKLQRYLDAGVTFFVDLTEPGELRPYANLLRLLAGDGTPVQYKRFAIRDTDIPRPAGQMAAILDTIDAAIAAGHTVYVHCWGGIGRTGTVVGCYLVRHGLSGEEALDQIARHWRTVEKAARNRSSPEFPAQREFVLRWAQYERPGAMNAER